MNIRPIKTRADYRAALKQIEKLWGAAAGSHAAETLEVLSTLVEVYEDEHMHVPPPHAIQAVEFRLEQSKLTRKDLAAILGVGRGRVSEVLSGKRGFTLGMIRKLVIALDIPADTLIQPYRQPVRDKTVRKQRGLRPVSRSEHAGNRSRGRRQPQ